MRVGFWGHVILAITTLVAPASVFGQFQPPTSEELSMTAEPKAPGAAAIYLYREETTDDNLHFHTFFARIKVLTEKGKELATVEVPYSRNSVEIKDIKARTIHADGTVIPLNVKPTDLVERKGQGSQINRIVFTMPNVEVGSILEYRWSMRYDDNSLSSPNWDLQQKFFVRNAHYSFLPYKYMGDVTNSHGDVASKLLYSTMLPATTKIVHDKNSDRYTLDTSDILALPEDDYMPPIGSLMEQVQFYYTPYVSKDEFWKKEGERWSKDMDHFANPSKGLREAAATIIAPADSEMVKAQKLYDAVMALDNTDYSRRKSSAEMKHLHLKEIKDAEDVWKQKSGSSDEIALLYIAMARAAGLRAHAFAVCNRDRELFNPYFLSMGQLDDVLAVVSIADKDTVVDPGTKFAPFGQLDWRHALTDGLRQSDKEAIFGRTPAVPYKDALTSRTADVTIAADGTVSGIVRFLMNGPEALMWRHRAIENDEAEVKKQFNEHMRDFVPEGVNAEFDHFIGLNDYKSFLMGSVKLSGNMGTVTGKRVFLPGVFFESRAKHPFVAEEKRSTPVDMEYANTIQDEVTYHVPDSFSVESAPPDTSIPWAGRALFSMKSEATGNSITMHRTLVRGFTLLPAADYPTLRDFYQKIATADNQQLVLKAAPPAPAKSTGGN